jgi:hypothetical protein
MTLKRHKVAQLRRVELTSSGFQTQKVTFTNHQVPSPFVFKGKAEDGVNLFFGFHSNNFLLILSQLLVGRDKGGTTVIRR